MLLKLVKISAVVLLVYVHTGGLLFDVPRLNILNESIRSVYFHVPMWFGMVFLALASVFFSVRYLSNPTIENDTRAAQFANVCVYFGLLGMVTGMIWAKFTWGSAWHGDPKQICAAITLLVYAAYFVLRGSIDNQEQRARLSAVYNIFAFASLVPLLFIIPRMYDSLHPGSGGNPGFNRYDLDDRMRLVFYPAVIGWICLGFWIADLRTRYKTINEKLNDEEDLLAASETIPEPRVKRS